MDVLCLSPLLVVMLLQNIDGRWCSKYNLQMCKVVNLNYVLHLAICDRLVPHQLHRIQSLLLIKRLDEDHNLYIFLMCNWLVLVVELIVVNQSIVVVKLERILQNISCRWCSMYSLQMYNMVNLNLIEHLAIYDWYVPH